MILNKIILVTVLILPNLSLALEADDLCQLEGYTIVACTNVVGEFEGADFDKLVELDNGMIFRFQEYNYTYAYRPSCTICARMIEYEGKELLLYMLVIEDEVYSVTRVV